MMHYDVFNGDADGICALLQIRLANPLKTKLITGVKRDIKLLSQVATQDDVSGVIALDISMEKNLEPLHAILEQEIPVFYCDHHRHGDVPVSNCLTALIDLDAETCTSLLINKHLKGAYAKWAVVGAFGDNMFVRANALAQELGLNDADVEFLKELGTLINYNGYGATLDDLHIAPATLYQALLKFDCPLALRDDLESPYYVLKKGYESDYANVEALTPIQDSAVAKVFELPCEAWARRISGVFGNELANLAPSTAHGVLTLNANGEDYTVSVRAPLSNRTGADEICSSFPTGGGRKAAAGINQLPVSSKQDFVEALTRYYQ
jgi:hypothetical protein